MVNHINSVPRAKYDGLCAFQVQEIIPSSFNLFKGLKLKRKYSNEIDLKPSLLKAKKDTK